jgi:predicted aspartyl protease
MRAKEKIVCLLLLTSFAVSAGPVRAGNRRTNPDRPDSATLTHIITLKIYRNFLVVAQGQIGGITEAQNFILDTGSAPSIVNSRVATQLGLATTLSNTTALGKTIPIQAATIPDIELGPIRAVSLPVLVEDLSRLEHECGIPIAGIIGLDMLSKSSFRLNYDSSEIQFGPTSHEGIPVHFDARAGIAVAEVRLRGKPVRMLVDTGSDVLVLLGGNFAEAGWLELRNTSQRGTTLAEQNTDLQIFSAPEILLGGKHFSKDTAYFAPGSWDPAFDGVLGVRALGFRALSYDQLSGTIFLEK